MKVIPLSIACCLAGQLAAQTPAPSTDVYVYRLAPMATRVINITNRAGYDNQPGWFGSAVYYTAQSGGQTDIRVYSLETGAVAPVTSTPESEYSAAPTPDGTGMAVIRVEMDSAQRLWRFPLHGTSGHPA